MIFDPSKPNALDLFCCEGGMGKGLADRFNVFGVDIFDKYTQKRYPFPSFKGDAIAALGTLLAGGKITFTLLSTGETFKLGLSDFAYIHASPPCQHASAGTRQIRLEGTIDYPEYIAPTRVLLEQTGLPWTIENVVGADLRDPVKLCGCMFGENGMTAVDTDGILLHLERARLFESNVPLVAPRACNHDNHEWVGGSYGGARRDKYEAKYVRKGGYVPAIKVQQELLGIDWMTQNGMFQSIPPVYASWLAWQVTDYMSMADDLLAGVEKLVHESA